MANVSTGTRADTARIGRRLQYVTILWSSAECIAALVAGLSRAVLRSQDSGSTPRSRWRGAVRRSGGCVGMPMKPLPRGLKPGEKVVTDGSFFLRAVAARTRSDG